MSAVTDKLKYMKTLELHIPMIQAFNNASITGTSREGAYSRQGAYSGQGAYFFLEKQPNVLKKY